jgi:hypothetical protein
VSDAGVVEGDIDFTVALLNVLRQAANFLGACHISLEELHAQLPADEFSSIGVDVGDNDGGTVILQSFGCLKADSTGSASNDRYAVL